MNKEQYCEKLSQQLGDVSYREVNEIVDEIKMHFDMGIANGKTEEQICEELGSPEELGAAYIEGGMAQLPAVLKRDNSNAYQNAAKASEKDPTLGRIFVIFFNIFVAVWIWLAWLAASISLVGSAIAKLISFVMMFSAYAFVGPFLSAYIMFHIASFLNVILLAILSYFCIKLLIVATKKYINWNKKLWNEGF